MRGLRFCVCLALLVLSGCAAVDDTSTTSELIGSPTWLVSERTGTPCEGDNDCADDNPCTEDLCLTDQGCAYIALSMPCDDADPCTVGEFCSDGVCAEGEDACGCITDSDCADLDDGDLCNGTFRCDTSVAPYACIFDVDSVVTCDAAPDACQVMECDPATGQCEAEVAADGQPCQPEGECSELGACEAGVCVGAPSSTCEGQSCGESPQGCPCGTCAEDAICLGEGQCLESGAACGDVPPEGICESGALLRCESGVLTVEPCADCCRWSTSLGGPICTDGKSCDGCTDACEPGTSGCNTLGTHAWSCEENLATGCLERSYQACPSSVCAPETGSCVDVELDDDDDGLPDELDNCPSDSNPSQEDGDGDGVGDACDDDDDGDGVPDEDDNCPELIESDTTDTDEDGLGDPCDPDDDGDGVLDESDNCAELANLGQADLDGDGVGDACDEDIDGDGTDNDEDSCPEFASDDLTDTDGDGLGDVCDDDDDNDEVKDGDDNCPLVPNSEQLDYNGDGEGDACDPEDPAPCSFDELENLAPSPLPASFILGEFEVELTTESIVVHHLDEPSRALFASPSNGTWLHLAQAELTAEEHQGSFTLEEQVLARCEEPHITSAHFQSGSLLLFGVFIDDDAACESATWTAQLCQAGQHRLGLEVKSDDPTFNLIALRTESDAEEYIWGVGEQFPHHSLNLNGRTLPVVSQEGGIGRGHLPITPAVNVFSAGSGGSESSTYYAAAHYLTSRARSVFLENTEAAFFDFEDELATELRLYADRMKAQIVHGTEPLSLIERFTDWTGRMIAPPSWANEGAVVALARPLETSLEYVDGLLNAGAALSAVWNQTWSGIATTYIGEQVLWNWVLNESTHPGWHDWVDALDDRGLKVLCYINTMFRALPEDIEPPTRDLYTEGLEGDYFVRGEDGETLMLPVTAFDVALLDLSNEEAREWMKSIITDEMLDNARCSGWMADFAEALPFEAVMADGQTGEVWHNRYPVEWAALNREALTEAGRLDDVLVYNRSGHTKSPGSSLTLWQGDQLVTWDRYDGLVSALHGLISGGFSGLAINHSDIGGYTSMAWLELGYSREEELLRRWTEMAAFTALMRTHEGNQPALNAQVYTDEASMEHFARMTKVYRALGFYREQLFEEAATRGFPVVRHLVMHWPTEEALYDVSDQFLLGSEFLVAPIKNKCFNWNECTYDKTVTLPPGQWVHLWTGAVYGEPQAVSEITVSAPIGEPAVFYPLGSPVAATFVDNLMEEGIPVASSP